MRVREREREGEIKGERDWKRERTRDKEGESEDAERIAGGEERKVDLDDPKGLNHANKHVGGLIVLPCADQPVQRYTGDHVEDEPAPGVCVCVCLIDPLWCVRACECVRAGGQAYACVCDRLSPRTYVRARVVVWVGACVCTRVSTPPHTQHTNHVTHARTYT